MGRIACYGNDTWFSYLYIDETKTVWSEDFQATCYYPYKRKSLGFSKKECSPVSQLAGSFSGNGHAAILREDGKVFGVGSNQWGQLSGGDPASLPEISSIYGFSNIVAVATGTTHTLAIDDSYCVWGVGRNFGQLGKTNTVGVFTPMKIQGIPPIRAVCAGSASSLFLDFEGKVWYCGVAPVGTYDHNGVFDPSFAIPHVLPFENEIVQISMHCSKAMFWDSKDNVFLASSNGIVKLELNFTPLQILSGSCTNFVLDTEGKLWSIGSNLIPQFAFEQYLPPMVEIFYIMKGVLTCTKDGQLFEIHDQMLESTILPKELPFKLLPKFSEKQLKSARTHK